MVKNTEKQTDTEYFEVTVEGSLGLLAYGDVGLRAWRKVKKQDKQLRNEEKK